MAFSLKKIFAAETKEYDFANGTKSAHVTTTKGFLTSSYKIVCSDSSIGLKAEATGSAVLSNCTERGVQKAKDFCGLKA